MQGYIRRKGWGVTDELGRRVFVTMGVPQGVDREEIGESWLGKMGAWQYSGSVLTHFV